MAARSSQSLTPSQVLTVIDDGNAAPKILIPEKVSAEGLSTLADFTIHQPKNLAPNDLLSIIPDYHALIVRSETKVTAEVLAAARNLKVVARAGVGVDNIDVDAATKHGIIVVNSPSGNIAAAAEHTIALLMAVARNVPAGDRSLRSGQWARSKLVGTEVGGKTLGIIGLGKVGMKVARMAIGLGMQVLAMDPFASPDLARGQGIMLVQNLDGLLPVVDFLTIHTPLMASTLDLIGGAEFAKMKSSAKVLNVARGGVYNEQALLEALDFGTIAGAALDVFTSEPPAPDSAAHILSQHAKVVVTPHLGASTVEAQENVSNDVCNQVAAILKGGMPTSAVNAPIILPEEYRKLQPFVRLIEKMGSLYTQHFCRPERWGIGNGYEHAAAIERSDAGLGGKAFELIYEGELATMTNTRPLFAALVKGLTGTFSEGRGQDVNIVNASLIAQQRGMVIDETHARAGGNELVYASLVSLRVTNVTAGGGKKAGESSRSKAAFPNGEAQAQLNSSTTSSKSSAGANSTIKYTLANVKQAASQLLPGSPGKKESTSVAKADTVVTTHAAPAASSQQRRFNAQQHSHVISGFVSERNIYISRIDRFETNFTPENRLLIMHNYDEPGKIGGVGGILGRHGINVRFMSVARIEGENGDEVSEDDSLDNHGSLSTHASRVPGKATESPSIQDLDAPVADSKGPRKRGREALMILGVDREVKRNVIDELEYEDGILSVTAVDL